MADTDGEIDFRGPVQDIRGVSDLVPLEEPSRYLPHIAKAITTFGRIYNGFEVRGTDNIPKDRPALIVFYHGLMPLDAWYFGLQYYLETGKLIRGLGDRWLFQVPGLSQLVRAVGGVEGSPEMALNLLKKGNLVGVAPGGVREAISGTSKNYRLLWQDRKGFARVALQANVDVIPAFTENIEEIYRAPFADRSVFQDLYEKTRLPLVPILGLGALPFPVKLRTWIGEPIRYSKDETPETLKHRTEKSLQALIDRHQIKEQTPLRAMAQRTFGF